MSPLHQLPPVEAGQTMAEAFTAERQNAIENLLRDVSSGRNLRGIGGLRVYRGQGGVTLGLRRRPGGGGGGGGGVAATLYPWDGEMETSTLFRFTRAGSINSGGMPTNMFSGGAYLSVATGAETWIKLDVTTDGERPTSCVISSSGTPAAPVNITAGAAPLSFSVDLWVVVSGFAVKVVGNGNIFARPIIASSEDSGGVACGENPWVNSWSWAFSS